MDYVLKLYIIDQTMASKRAIKAVREIVETLDSANIDLDIIDILEDPKLAESEKIFATPLLVRESPKPVIRLIGDLEEKEEVLMSLGIVGDHDV